MVASNPNLRIERRHRPHSGMHLGSGEIVCLDGERVAGRVKYVFWDTPKQYALHGTHEEERLKVEGPFFRRYRPGHWIAGIEIEISEEYRTTPALWMLIQALDAMDMPIYALFANERLGRIFRRRYRSREEPSMRNLPLGKIVKARRGFDEHLLALGSNETACGMEVDGTWQIYRHYENEEAVCWPCIAEDMLTERDRERRPPRVSAD
jgi:hypothetical protein